MEPEVTPELLAQVQAGVGGDGGGREGGKTTLGAEGDDDGEAWRRMRAALRPRIALWVTTLPPGSGRGSLSAASWAERILSAIGEDLIHFKGTNVRAFMAWVFQIAEHCIRDHIAGGASGVKPVAPPEALDESTLALIEAVESLGTDQQEIIRWLRLEERTPEEVAACEGMSAGAVRIRYVRALSALRRAMDVTGNA